ncbi:MAG: hypothetical protein AAF393_14420 [Pseudomonadota bacterium]
MKRFLFAALLCIAPTAQAQFMTASEVRPILEATKANWVGVREFDGRDLLYFTHILTFRCGLQEIAYGINDDEYFSVWEMPDCYEGTSSPFALKPTDRIYDRLPLMEVRTITVVITYDDGSLSEMTYDRAQIQLP